MRHVNSTGHPGRAWKGAVEEKLGHIGACA